MKGVISCIIYGDMMVYCTSYNTTDSFGMRRRYKIAETFKFGMYVGIEKNQRLKPPNSSVGHYAM